MTNLCKGATWEVAANGLKSRDALQLPQREVAPTLKDLYWAAGFIEGEGNIRFTHFKDWSGCVGIKVGQVQREPLDRLQRWFSGTIHFAERLRRPTHQPIYNWHLNGMRAVGLAMTLYPMMSPKRQEQIRNALAEWRKIPTHRMYLSVCGYGHKLEGDNLVTFERSTNKRRCRICKNRWQRVMLWRRKLREQKIEYTNFPEFAIGA